MNNKLFSDQPSKRRRSLSMTAILASVAVLAAVGSALAGVSIYQNDFSSKGEFKQLRNYQTSKACDRSWRDKNAVQVEVKRGIRSCVYRTRVENDRSQGDLDLRVKAKLTNATQKGARKTAYVGTGVRYGKKDGYVARVFGNKTWRISRKPDSADFPVGGTSNAIKPVGKSNKLRIRVDGSQITFWVNGKRMISKKSDPSPNDVKGTKAVLIVGSNVKNRKNVVGIFDNLNIGIP